MLMWCVGGMKAEKEVMNCLLQFILCVRVFFGIITFEWGFGDLNF
jgi:hypothetical protein